MSNAMIFLAESCVDLGFWCVICLKLLDGDRWSSNYEILSSLLAFFFTACLLFAPIYQFFAGLIFYRAVKREDKGT